MFCCSKEKIINKSCYVCYKLLYMYCQFLFSYFSLMSVTFANSNAIMVCILPTSRSEASLNHFFRGRRSEFMYC